MGVCVYVKVDWANQRSTRATDPAPRVQAAARPGGILGADSRGERGARARGGGRGGGGLERQGLTLDHFSAQPEPFLSLKLHETTQRIPQNVLTSSQEVDERESVRGFHSSTS